MLVKIFTNSYVFGRTRTKFVKHLAYLVAENRVVM